MEQILKSYAVKIVREAGPEPLTGKMYERAEEDLHIEATSLQSAHIIAELITSLKFCGQEMVVIIDGNVHLDERF